MIMDGDRLHWPRVHVDIPDLEGQVVPRQDVSPVVTELDVGYRRNDLGKE